MPPASISPAPGASSRSSGMAGRGWEGVGASHSAPKGNCRARPVPLGSRVPLGTGASWSHGRRPSRPVGAATPKPRRRGRAEGRGASAPLPSNTRGCPRCQPAHQHSGRATPVAFCLLGRCPGPPVCPGRGVPGPPMAVPAPGISLLRAGDGHRQPPGFGQTQSPWKLREQFPRRGSAAGDAAGGGQGGHPGRLRVSNQSRLAHLCSPAGLGRVQERLKNHKPDSSPRVTSLGPLCSFQDQKLVF